MIAVALISAAPVPPQKTIFDLYIEAPTTVIEIEAGNRAALITVKDVKNGYLEAEPLSDVTRYTFALFNSTRGPLVGVVIAAANSDLKFYLVNEKWKDVTSEVFPKLSLKDISAAYRKAGVILSEQELSENAGDTWRAVLPQKGTTIKIVSAIDDPRYTGIELMILSFNRTQFNIAK